MGHSLAGEGSIIKFETEEGATEIGAAGDWGSFE